MLMTMYQVMFHLSLQSPSSSRRGRTFMEMETFATMEEGRSEKKGLTLSKRNLVGESHTVM